VQAATEPRLDEGEGDMETLWLPDLDDEEGADDYEDRKVEARRKALVKILEKQPHHVVSDRFPAGSSVREALDRHARCTVVYLLHGATPSTRKR